MTDVALGKGAASRFAGKAAGAFGKWVVLPNGHSRPDLKPQRMLLGLETPKQSCPCAGLNRHEERIRRTPSLCENMTTKASSGPNSVTF